VDKWCPNKEILKIFLSILCQDVIRPFEVVGCSFAWVLNPEEGEPEKHLPQQAIEAGQPVPRGSLGGGYNLVTIIKTIEERK